MYITLGYIQNGFANYQGPFEMAFDGASYYIPEVPLTHFLAPGWYDLPPIDNDDGVSQIMAYVHPNAEVSLGYIEGYCCGWFNAAKDLVKPAPVPSLN